MIIKSFTADTVAAALKQIKTEMGADAVVLSTRQLTGGRVEVTACCEQAAASRPAGIPNPEVTARKPSPVSRRVQPAVFRRHDPSPAGTPDRSQDKKQEMDAEEITVLKESLARIENRLDALSVSVRAVGNSESDPAEVRAVREKLHAQDFSERNIDALMQRLRGNSETDAMRTALRAFVREHTASMPSLEPGDTVLFLGPGGCGKTSALGKLAADLTLAKKQAVRLTSLDNGKVGAVDELQSYADILAAVTESSSQERTGTVVTLVDSPALPRDNDTIQTWAQKCEDVGATYRFAVISACLRTADLRSVCERLRLLQPTHLIATMTDLTTCWGGIFEVASALEIPLTLVTDAPSGEGKLSAPDIDTLVSALLPEEVSA